MRRRALHRPRRCRLLVNARGSCQSAPEGAWGTLLGGVVARTRSITRAAAFALALTLGGCQWTQGAWGREQRAYNPAESRLTSANVRALTEVWSAPLALNANALQVLSAGGRVFVPAADGTHALDLESGAEVWSDTDRANTGFLVLVR